MDANYLVYLLDLFEGRLSVEDVLNMDFKLLAKMQAVKEEQLNKRIVEMKKNEMQRKKDTETNYINNKGERYHKNGTKK